MYYQIIGINKLLFISNVTVLKASAAEISVVTGSVAEYNSVSAALDGFEGIYRDISSLIRDYRQLLIRDSEKLRRAGEEIIHLDETLSY